MRVAQCGTPSGYVRHRRLDEMPCVPCSDARADERRVRRVLTGDVATVRVTARVLGLLLSGDPDALRQAVAELGQRTVDAALVVAARDDTKEAS